MHITGRILNTGLLLLSILVSCAQPYSSSKTSKAMSDEFVRPAYLQAGDTVAIVAPSGVLIEKDEEIQWSKQLLQSWGLEVKLGRHIFEKAGHFAGTDEQRIEDLQWAIDDPSIKAIWAARGGYGTVRVVDHIDLSALRSKPKWIVGYSDITALHNELHNFGLESIHAMMCSSLKEDTTEIETSINSFKNALFGTPLAYDFKGSSYNRTGKANGQLVGGNLTLLHTMLGSSSDISTEGKIVFIEEIGEYAYHIDRMLMSLKRAGFFEGCAGLVVGDISKVRKNTTPWGKPIEQLVLDAFEDYDFPIAFGLPAGHESDNRALILGRRVILNVKKEGTALDFED